jgi:hypothetical protein
LCQSIYNSEYNFLNLLKVSVWFFLQIVMDFNPQIIPF